MYIIPKEYNSYPGLKLHGDLKVNILVLWLLSWVLSVCKGFRIWVIMLFRIKGYILHLSSSKGSPRTLLNLRLFLGKNLSIEAGRWFLMTLSALKRGRLYVLRPTNKNVHNKTNSVRNTDWNSRARKQRPYVTLELYVTIYTGTQVVVITAYDWVPTRPGRKFSLKM